MKLDPQSIVDRLPGEARHALSTYHDLLLDRAVPAGMIAAGDRKRLWERHVLDSVRGVPCLPSGAHQVVDLGSGAGLPGIPIAICRPALRVNLVEPRSRRAAFLELVLEQLRISNVHVLPRRAEELSLEADLCLARALGPAHRCWQLAQPLLSPTGALLLWAGRSWIEEGAVALSGQGVGWKICAQPGFSWEGPLVIIGAT